MGKTWISHYEKRSTMTTLVAWWILLSRVCRIYPALPYVRMCAQAITLMIIYDRGYKRVPDRNWFVYSRRRSSRDSMSTPRRAWVATTAVIFLLLFILLLLLLVVYISPPKLRFLTSSFAAVTIMASTTGGSRLNSGIYELHHRRGTRTPGPESLPTTDYTRASALV